MNPGLALVRLLFVSHHQTRIVYMVNRWGMVGEMEDSYSVTVEKPEMITQR